ncbi:MAG TPA: hypothetical protein VL475_00110, partial [Planctomycetaceae bacterium]|nr:hypothetical protein [Planctomycetaceae bacterium]
MNVRRLTRWQHAGALFAVSIVTGSGMAAASDRVSPTRLSATEDHACQESALAAGIAPLSPVADRRSDGPAADRLPPPSPVISAVIWAPAGEIVRRAVGSDNWPITSGDDGHLYAAYGDGNGFEPFVEKKLSLGLAKISGPPESFQGVNLRSADIEQLGHGAAGKKASGLLM